MKARLTTSSVDPARCAGETLALLRASRGLGRVVQQCLRYIELEELEVGVVGGCCEWVLSRFLRLVTVGPSRPFCEADGTTLKRD